MPDYIVRLPFWLPIEIFALTTILFSARLDVPQAIPAARSSMLTYESALPIPSMSLVLNLSRRTFPIRQGLAFIHSNAAPGATQFGSSND
jgi:hypothetical protein